MEELKAQIGELVRRIDGLNREIAEHWTLAQKMVSAHDPDGAISALNAYFRLKSHLEQAESKLTGILNGYFSGK